MANLTIPSPTLIQGVSQQPPVMRLPSQCELQENAYPSVLEGLQKRHPLMHLMKCFDGGVGSPLVHVINRSETERYLVLAYGAPDDTAPGSKAKIRVFDLVNGVEKTVNGPGATAANFDYLVLPKNACAQTMSDPDFRTGTNWTVSNNVAFGTAAAVAPPLGTRYDGPSVTTQVYKIGNGAGLTGASYYPGDYLGALVAQGVTYSLYVRRDDTGGATAATQVTLRLRTGGGGGTQRSCTFTLSASGAFTCSAGTPTNGVVPRVDTLPNGWFRIAVSYQPSSSQIGQDVRASIVFGTPASGTMLAWGCRFDNGLEPLDWIPSANDELRALTVNDYTFILNKTQAVRLTSSTTGTDPNKTAGFVFVAAGNYKTNYTVKLTRNGGSPTSVTVSTWDGTSATSLDKWVLDVTGPGAAAGVWQLTTYDRTVTYTNDGTPTAAEVETGLMNAVKTLFPHWSTNLFGTLSDSSPAGQLTMVAKYAGQTMLAAVTSPGGAAAYTLTHTTDTEATSIKTDSIAQALATAIIALGDGWGATVVGSVVKVTNSNGDITQLECTDSRGNQNLFAVWSKVQSFDTLPTVCQHDHVITVAGDPVAHEDDYYVKFVANAGSGMGEGVWVETVRPTNASLSDTTQTSFDATTMPYQLVRVADGTFEFGPVSWTDRLVGDDTTNVIPSMVSDASTDRFIDNLFFWKNRLGFLSGQNVLMSEVGRYFNFWKTTVRTLLDSDRIDTSVPHTSAVQLRYAIPFDDALFLFSDQTQFRLSGDPTLTAKTVQTAAVLEFSIQKKCHPLGIARGIFFANKRGDFSGLQQFVGSPNTNRVDALDIGAHCPKYIAGDATRLVGSDTETMIAVLADGEPGSLFVYKYFDNGQERLQSAWHKYTVGTNASVLGGDFIGNVLYLAVQRFYGVCIESMTVAPGEVDTGLSFQVALDRRINGGPSSYTPGVYGAPNTVWTLPYPVDPSATFQVVRQDTGVAITVSQSTDASNVTTLTASGDFSAVPVYIGQQFTMRYRFTRPVLREQSGQGKSPVNTGRLQTLRGYLAYHDSQYLKVAVTPDGRPTEYATLDSSTSGTDVLSFAVGCDAKKVIVDVTNDTHRPSNITNVEWECLYTTRSTRAPS